MNWQKAFWSVLVLLIVSNIFYMYILRKNALDFVAQITRIQEMCKKQ